jgi:hypothetical protein
MPTFAAPTAVPEDYARIKRVESLTQLFAAAATVRATQGRDHNAVLLPRRLSGDFNALAQALRAMDADYEGKRYREMDYDALAATGPLADAGAEEARQHILADMRMTRAYQRGTFWFGRRLATGLRVITNYNLAAIEGFHKDGRPRLCCCYNAPATEGIRDQDAVALQGPLRGNVYGIKEGARPFAFAPGDLWYQFGGGSPKKRPYFIHRGPSSAGAAPRLMMIADLR